MKDGNLDFSDQHVVIEVNARIYAISAILSAAYIILDKCYVVVDGDPADKVTVLLRPKAKPDKMALRKLAEDFNSELLNYSVYEKQVERNGKLREEMLKRALLTNLGKEDDYLKDEEEILVPWEEKYGRK
jgi:His-Xaa-Ser system protein HxsD